jgi:hypothetical protein
MTDPKTEPRSASTCRPVVAPPNTDTVETRLWPDEHLWLYALMRCSSNVAPTFRFPDLISACVTQVFSQANPAPRIFHYLRTQLIQRDPQSARLRERMWRAQDAPLLDLQRDPFTTTCVALCRLDDDSGATVFRFARQNMVQRANAALLEPCG